MFLLQKYLLPKIAHGRNYLERQPIAEHQTLQPKVGADSVRRAMCSSQCTMHFGRKGAFPEAARTSRHEKAGRPQRVTSEPLSFGFSAGSGSGFDPMPVIAKKMPLKVSADS